MAAGVETLRQAIQAFEARDRRRAAALLRQLDGEAPDIGGNWGPASRLAAAVGEVELALSAARRALALKPQDLDQVLVFAATAAGLGRVEEALETTLRFAAAAPADPRLEHLAGTLHAQLGQEDAALARLRASLALPTFPQLAAAAWLAIADLKTFGDGDSDLEAMEALARRVGPATPSALHYALGKAHYDLGRYDAAFGAYEAGAAQVRAQRPFDAAASAAFVDEVTSPAGEAALDALPASGLQSERPIFVLGLPRSGTTLIEQMLASHSAVAGGGELNLFRKASMALDGYGPAGLQAFARAGDPAAAFARMGEDYLHLLTERFGPDGRVVDKTLNHSRFLGLIRRVLPNARFVWMRREPGDAALSCYRSHFAQGVNWSWSFADIGRHFRDEDRLHAHWSARFPEAILTVPYEGLVSEPEAWMRRVLDHCGLAYEPGVLAFHRTERAVTTTSSRQVRQPLYSRAVGGWRRHADRLAPFFAAYGAPSPK